MNKINIFTNTHLIQIQKSGTGWTLYVFSEVGGQKLDEMTDFTELKNAIGYAREKYFAGSEWL